MVLENEQLATVPADIDRIIDRLLEYRLTRFGYAFCLGLRGNPNPSPRQKMYLRGIINRHPQVIVEQQGDSSRSEPQDEKSAS